MNRCLKLKESNCKNCYKCIRYCPVKAISFKSTHADIVQDECILCGQCFVICPQNAKDIRYDVPVAKALIESGVPVYASVAPSFAANYGGTSIELLREALINLGFTDAFETAVGAVFVKNRYEELLLEKENKLLISSCCHSVNLLIQKYYPQILSSLAKVKSPMQAHSEYIKQKFPNAKTVFIGPCISKKSEADTYPDIVDCVLTFEELSGWFKEVGIVPKQDTNINKEGKTRLFPTPGGIIRTMNTDDKFDYIVIDGVDNCIDALDDMSSGRLKNCFVEMSMCKGSCVGGPGMDKRKISPVSGYVAINRSAGELDFPVQQPSAETLTKNIVYHSVNVHRPGGSQIEEVLRKMGKNKPSDELNCGSCGYNTCRDKAAAIIAGKANTSMCLPYLMEKALSFSDTIISNTPNGVIVLNEALEIQQINSAACHFVNAAGSQELLNKPIADILDPRPFMEVVETHRNIYERRTYLAEYKLYVMMTVIFDSSYKVIMIIMRNVTEEEISKANKEEMKRKTIEVTDKVIAKQMRTVQEVASLLGETTAETKVALTKLKETLLNDR